jgi:hypothetical protein
LDTEIDNVFEMSLNLKIWPWRRPGWKKLDPTSLDKEIANVSEGGPKQGNVALEAPRLEKLRFDRFR